PAGIEQGPGPAERPRRGETMSRLSEWFANTAVRNKILLGYALILAFMFVIAVVVAIQAERIQRENDQRERIEALWATTLDLSRAFASMNGSVREHALTGDPRSLTAYEEFLEQKQQAFRDAMEVANQSQQEVLSQAEAAMQAWQSSAANVAIPLRQATLQPGGPPVDSVIAWYQQGVARDQVQQARS